MWIARNKDGSLKLTNIKPYFKENNGKWFSGREFDGDYIYIDRTLFPNLKWNDEPIEVSLVPSQCIEIIKNKHHDE